jgi:O-antigen/teichoic acid export membrane protein
MPERFLVGAFCVAGVRRDRGGCVIRSRQALIARLLAPSTTAFFDQFSLSGLNFISIILVARVAPKLDFASYSLTLAIWAFFVSLQRTVIVLPMMVAHSDTEFEQVPGKWIYVNFGYVAVVTIGLLAAWRYYLFTGNVFAIEAMQLSLIVTPPMLVFEFCRRLMYQIDRNLDASLFAVIVAICYTIGIGISTFHTHTAMAAVAGMALGGLLASLLAFVRHPREFGLPSLAGYRQLWKLAPPTTWHFLSFLAHSTFNTALPIVVATFGTPTAVAALVATRNLTNPMLTISTAVDSFEKPRSGRAFREGGMTALRATTNRTRRFLMMINTPIMIVLAVAAPLLVKLMRGGGHAEYVYLIYLWIGVVTAILINQPYETALIIQRKTAVLFWSKLAGGVVLLAGAATLVPRYGAFGALYATLGATIVNLLVNAIRARHNFELHNAQEKCLESKAESIIADEAALDDSSLAKASHA